MGSGGWPRTPSGGREVVIGLGEALSEGGVGTATLGRRPRFSDVPFRLGQLGRDAGAPPR